MVTPVTEATPSLALGTTAKTQTTLSQTSGASDDSQSAAAG